MGTVVWVLTNVYLSMTMLSAADMYDNDQRLPEEENVHTSLRAIAF